MIEIVQDVISTDVAGPLPKGVWGLFKTLEALPMAPEPLGWDGIIVKEIALARSTPEEAHPMLTWQVDGIGVGNGAPWVGHLVGSIHIQKISADEGIVLAGSWQGRCVVHVFLFTSLPREGVLVPSHDCPPGSDSRPYYRKTGLGGVGLPLLKVTRMLSSIP